VTGKVITDQPWLDSWDLTAMTGQPRQDSHDRAFIARQQPAQQCQDSFINTTMAWQPWQNSPDRKPSVSLSLYLSLLCVSFTPSFILLHFLPHLSRFLSLCLSVSISLFLFLSVRLSDCLSLSLYLFVSYPLCRRLFLYLCLSVSAWMSMAWSYIALKR
jgi:hypothetical protein